jgi:hypothetical protein
VFGRESLREVVRNQHQEMQEFLRDQREESLRYQEESRIKHETLVEETREFNRELLLRNEKVVNKAIAEIEEGRKQIRANTEAVLALLDRFDKRGGAAA